MNFIIVRHASGDSLINLDTVTNIYRTKTEVHFRFIDNSQDGDNYIPFVTDIPIVDVHRKLNNSSTLDLRRCDDKDSNVHR